jgi:hypothetical protein
MAPMWRVIDFVERPSCLPKDPPGEDYESRDASSGSGSYRTRTTSWDAPPAGDRWGDDPVPF